LLKKGLIIAIITSLILSVITPTVVGYSTKFLFEDTHSYNTKLDNELPNIMLTGYWNPTGQMIAPFSNDTFLNPDGWKGENWEDRGYNIYSFFPTPGIYNGTFEIDYQDTWEDFWSITTQVKPIAIINFGAGGGPWEIEFNARNFLSWANDYVSPHQPTPCPPDNTVPVGYVRHSTLPVQGIEDAVNEQTSINAWVDWEDDPGSFLCGYMAYLGMWYQSIHKNDDLHPCKAAGFIHVSKKIVLEDAMETTNITIRETIEYLSCVQNSPGAPTITGKKTGRAGEEYEYTFISDDPDNDEIFFYINWGDGQIEKWLGPFESGKGVVVSHIWSYFGIYKIKAIAKDTCGALSDWETLRVIMPRNRLLTNILDLHLLERFQNLFPILQRLLFQRFGLQ
jgi:pyrrolidone-carboxylate peptidase